MITLAQADEHGASAREQRDISDRVSVDQLDSMRIQMLSDFASRVEFNAPNSAIEALVRTLQQEAQAIAGTLAIQPDILQRMLEVLEGHYDSAGRVSDGDQKKQILLRKIALLEAKSTRDLPPLTLPEWIVALTGLGIGLDRATEAGQQRDAFIRASWKALEPVFKRTLEMAGLTVLSQKAANKTGGTQALGGYYYVLDSKGQPLVVTLDQYGSVRMQSGSSLEDFNAATSPDYESVKKVISSIPGTDKKVPLVLEIEYSLGNRRKSVRVGGQMSADAFVDRALFSQYKDRIQYSAETSEALAEEAKKTPEELGPFGGSAEVFQFSEFRDATKLNSQDLERILKYED